MTPVADRMSDRQPGRRPTGAQVVAIASGKGGVGKTVLAVNLGVQLARRQQRVILLDADFGLANADILLNVAPRADYAALLDPTRSLEDLLVSGPAGLRLAAGLPGRGRNGRELGPLECGRLVERLRGLCDVLLVDCSAGLDATVVTLALASDLLIIATTPEPTALADGYATLKLVCNCGYTGRAGVIVNMARSWKEGEDVARRLARVAEQFLGLAVENMGHVPPDRHVPRAVRLRVPVSVRYPRCPASACMERIAARFAPAACGPAPGLNLWARAASLFL
jgi:flagellar biosynthesis protein FlhG